MNIKFEDRITFPGEHCREMSTLKRLITNILDKYKLLPIDVEGETVYPTRGVQQGCLFGEVILFMIYINDIIIEANKNTK